MSKWIAPARARVLVVDDEAANRELIQDALEAGNYHVVTAAGGRDALRAIRSGNIDVVVLDVVMPDVDGLEVCRLVRGDPTTASLPVILVTAHHGREERLKGIEAGASDFLRKPLDLTDLTLRVRNAVAVKRLHDQTVRDYERVVELESLRDNLVHMIIHDLRSPLTSMRTNLQLVELDAAGVLPDDSIRMIREAIDGTTVFTQMVTSILDVSRLEAGELPLKLERRDLRTVTKDALKSLGTAASSVQLSSPPIGVEALCDGDLIRRVVVNIVSNAIDFSPESCPARLELTVVGDSVRFSCSDRGPGIPQGAQKKIFDKFGQADAPESRRSTSSGLGLTFCKLAVSAHGGRVGVESVVGMGSTFWFELPISGPTTDSGHELSPIEESVEAGPVPAV